MNYDLISELVNKACDLDTPEEFEVLFERLERLQELKEEFEEYTL